MLNKNEKKILLSIKVLPILIIVSLSAVVTYLFTVQNLTRFENEIKIIKEDFIKTNRLHVQYQIESLVQTITKEKEDAIEKLKFQIKHEVEDAHSIATKVYNQNKNLSKEELQNLIISILKDIRHEYHQNKLYITSNSDEKIIFPKNIKDEKNNSKKITYKKVFEPYNWTISTEISLDDYKNVLKQNTLNKLKNLSFNKSGYYFILNKKGEVLTDDIHIVESVETNPQIVQKIIQFSKIDSRFIRYKVNDDGVLKEKISFIKKIHDYDWIIGYGFYPFDIEKTIKSKELELEKQNDIIKRRMFFINVIVTFFLVVILIFFSDFVKQQFIIYRNKNREYQDKLHHLLDDKTIRLEKLNKTLEQRVQLEVKKNRDKDKIMFQQSKMAAMGELLAMIAHQWRQPLAQINSITLNMYTNYKKGNFTLEVLKKDIMEIENTTDFLSQTITDFSTFFRPEKEKHTFSTKQAIDECLHLLFPKGSHKVIINVEVKKDSNIHGYITQYQQAVLTILINSLDIFDERHIEFPKIDITIDSKENKSILTITDNAKGIKKDSLDRIFEAYYSTKKNKKNSGLGLHISKMIIEQNMNGTISAKNVNNGAQFTIII